MKKITLHNYQSHEKTIIKPAPTLTALTGRSDHGKSTVIRALRSVRDNKPAGKTFIRTGTKKAEVIVDNVTYEKTGSTTKYYIEGKKAPYKALRGAVPEEITKALNLGEVNIQGQHDSVFLLNNSPGKVAQQLSNLVDLEKPTKALAYIKAKKRQHTANADVLSKSIEDTELQLSKLEHVDSADKELTLIERKGVALEKLREKHSQLYTAHKNAVQAEYELSTIPSTRALKPAKQLLKHYNELQGLLREYRVLENSFNKATALEHLIHFDPTKLMKKAKRLKRLKERHNKLAAAINRATEFENEMSFLSVKEATLQKKKDKLLEGQCPLCGRSE